MNEECIPGGFIRRFSARASVSSKLPVGLTCGFDAPKLPEVAPFDLYRRLAGEEAALRVR
jgi:hypothetical protein